MSAPSAIDGRKARRTGTLWWIDAQAKGRFFAWGNLGQYIYVAPDKDAVIVRFGTEYAGVDWIPLLREIASTIP